MDYRLLDDEILVKLLKADDKTAFKEVYTRHWKSLFDTAYYRTGSSETAKELVQNLFLHIWEKRSSLVIAHLQAYLQTAIKNRVINHIERTWVQKKYKQQATATQNNQQSDTDDRAQYNDLDRAFKKALLQLPPKTRSVFEMSRFEQLSVKEIALRLQISEKAVEYHISSSLKMLRINLKDFMINCLIVGAIDQVL